MVEFSLRVVVVTIKDRNFELQGVTPSIPLGWDDHITVADDMELVVQFAEVGVVRGIVAAGVESVGEAQPAVIFPFLGDCGWLHLLRSSQQSSPGARQLLLASAAKVSCGDGAYKTGTCQLPRTPHTLKLTEI